MRSSYYLKLCLLNVLINGSYCVTGYGQCVQTSSCSCRYSDGTGNNLSGINPDQGYLTLTLKNSSVLYYHPCGDMIISEGNSTCGDVSLCMKTNNTFHNIGVASEANFQSNLVKGHSNTLTFQHKEGFLTVIKLVCTEGEESTYLFETNSTDSTLNLVLASPHSCLKDLDVIEGLSTGSVLVILFLLFGTAYLVGGAAILYFLRGARGKEMIPNVDFWVDLPFLVRDGVTFLQNGCTVQARANTYDQI